ncbi:helix-turn-helix transcriptional regulator [Rhodoferax sp.]
MPGANPSNQRGRVSATPPQPDRLIRLHEVCALTSVGKTSVYSIEGFPKRVQLSRRAVGWRLSEVQAWIETRVQAGGQ